MEGPKAAKPSHYPVVDMPKPTLGPSIPCGIKFSQWVEAHRESCGFEDLKPFRGREAPAAAHVISEASKTLNVLNVHNFKFKEWNILLCFKLALFRKPKIFSQKNIIGFPFAKPLCNFCKIFLSLRIIFAQNKTTICAIICKNHFAQNCTIPLLQNSSFAQFHNFVNSNDW